VDIPEDLVCPITQELMRNPVIAEDGNSYEKEAILQWLDHHPTSPLTREPISSTVLIPNRVVMRQIQEFKQLLEKEQIRKEMGKALKQLEKEVIATTSEENELVAQKRQVESEIDNLETKLRERLQIRDQVQSRLCAVKERRQQQNEQLEEYAHEVKRMQATLEHVHLRKREEIQDLLKMVDTLKDEMEGRSAMKIEVPTEPATLPSRDREENEDPRGACRGNPLSPTAPAREPPLFLGGMGAGEPPNFNNMNSDRATFAFSAPSARISDESARTSFMFKPRRTRRGKRRTTYSENRRGTESQFRAN